MLNQNIYCMAVFVKYQKIATLLQQPACEVGKTSSALTIKSNKHIIQFQI